MSGRACPGRRGYYHGKLRRVRGQPKIGPYLDRTAQIIEADMDVPRKQRHTAKRIFKRIREEGYEGFTEACAARRARGGTVPVEAAPQAKAPEAQA
jgi:transposase